MKLTKRLIAFLAIACLLPIIFIGFISINILDTRSHEISKKNIELTTHLFAKDVEDFLKEIELNLKIWRKKDIVQKTISESNLNKKSADYEKNVKYLSSVLKNDADEREVLKDTFIVNKNDITIMSNNPILLNEKIFCANEIDKNKKIDEFQITPIEIWDNYINGQRCFLILLPIYDEDEYCGFIGQSIDAGCFKKVNSNSILDEKPEINVIDSKGNFAYYSGTDPHITTEEFDQKNHSDFSEKINSINVNDKYGFFDFNMQGEKQHAYFSELGNTKWKLYSSVSEKEVLKPATNLTKIVLVLSFLLIGVIILIATYIFNSYLKPLRILYKTISTQNKKNQFIKFEYNKKDEFGKIAKVFNEMMKERVSDTQKLLDANIEFQTIVTNIPGGVYCCKVDENLDFTFVSDGLLKLLDCERKDVSEIYDNKAINILDPKDRLRIFTELKYQEIHGNMVEVECRLVRPDGSHIWVLDRSRMIINKNGEKLLYCVAVDITTSKAIQDELSQSKRQYQAILEQSEDIICEWNFLDDTATFSAFWHKKFGYDIPTENFSEFVYKAKYIHPDDMENFLIWFNNIKLNKESIIGEFRIKTFKNDYLWVSIKSTLIKNDNEVPVKVVGVITDITCEKTRIEKLLVEAQTDLLTGIYNKMTTETLIRSALSEFDFPNDKPALMIIDIDDFKSINDNLGHMLGDAVLCEIASNLKNVFRKNDIIGRIGGDEFIVFINGNINIENLKEKAQEISRRFTKKFVNKGESYQVSVSIGIAQCPCDGTTFEELYIHADNALYFAKSQGKDCFALFDKTMQNISELSEIQR